MASCKLILDIAAGLTAILGYLPLYPYLDIFPKLSVPGALVIMAVGSYTKRVLPVFPATGISGGIFIYCLLQISRANVVAPTISFLTLLLAIRLLSERAPRHYLQIFALSLFLLAASTIHEISVSFLVYLLLMLFVITAALVLLTFYFHNPDLRLKIAEIRKIAASALVMELAAMPLMIIIFIILPRTQYPLWRVIPASTTATTGFSETVHLGAVDTMSSMHTPVFRAEMQPIAKGNLYWRGIVLNTFAQGTWERKTPIKPEGALSPTGQPVQQVIQMEPGVSKYLCTLDFPLTVKGTRIGISPDRIFALSSVPVKRQYYEVLSVLAESSPARQVDKEFYLALPAEFSPRIRELARRVHAGADDVAGRIALAEHEFRLLNLTYTTRGLPMGPDPLDVFLFQSRQGNCEFFASSLVMVLRAAGIPARLVGGYYGGEYNNVGGYYLVTQEMAHVWVEAYQDGTGWRRLDPSAWSRGFSEKQQRRKSSWTGNIRMYIDAISYFWDRNIVPYDLERQINAVRTTSNALRAFNFDRKKTSVFLVTAVLLFLFACLVRCRRYLPSSREEWLVKAFQRVLDRRFTSFGKVDSIGFHGVAAQCHDPLVDEFVALYCSAVYRDKRLSADEFDRLRTILKLLNNN